MNTPNNTCEKKYLRKFWYPFMFSYCKANYDMCLYRLGPDNLNQYDDIHPSTSLLAFSGTEWIFSSVACLWVFATSDLALFCQSTRVTATSPGFRRRLFLTRTVSDAACGAPWVLFQSSWRWPLSCQCKPLGPRLFRKQLHLDTTTLKWSNQSPPNITCLVSFGRCNNMGTRW